MKYKMKRFTIATMVMSIVSLLFISCQKDKSADLETALTKSLPSSIPVYANYTALIQEIDTAYSFDTITQLVSYEQSVGRTSIGRLADVFYESTLPTKFSSQSDALAYYSTSQTYLDTIVDGAEIAIVPKWMDNQYRYVANTDGYFAVGNYVYRLFKHCMVYCEQKYYNGLTALTESSLSSLDTTKYHSTKPSLPAYTLHSNCMAYSYTVSGSAQSGNDKVFLKLETPIPFFPGLGFVHTTKLKAYCLHKWAGTWWTTRHNITIQGSISIHDGASGSTWNTISNTYNDTKRRNVMTIPVYSAAAYSGLGLSYYHYISASLSASYPGGPTASISF